MRLRERIQRMMYGRYGVDDLSRFLSTFALVLMILSAFTKWSLLYFFGLGIFVYAYYRAFSRNISKMAAQNQRFRDARYMAAVKRNKRKIQFSQRKIYRFYKCPQCKQKLRVQRGHGRICITCPKCKMEFVKKS